MGSKCVLDEGWRDQMLMTMLSSSSSSSSPVSFPLPLRRALGRRGFLALVVFNLLFITSNCFVVGIVNLDWRLRVGAGTPLLPIRGGFGSSPRGGGCGGG